MFKKSFILSLFFALIFSTITVQAAPLAEGYSYPTQLCSFPSSAQTNIINTGYDLHAYTYTSAYYVRRTLNKDAVFYISTHGLSTKYPDGSVTYGGAVATYNSLRSKTGSVSADVDNSDDKNYSLEGAWGSDSTALRAIRLAYWSACYSGQTSNYYGNLLYKSCQLGARCAFGFHLSVSNSQSAFFDTNFFMNAKNGRNVWACAYYSVQATRENYFSAGGVDNWEARCRNGLTIDDVYLTPASYGY